MSVDRGSPRDPAHEDRGELELELEYFERVPLTARLALLRVAGAWSGPVYDGIDQAPLVVDDGRRRRRFKPLAEPPEGASHQWRAAYAVPVALTDRSEVAYALDVGTLVDLPSPTARSLTAPVAATGRDPAGGPDGLEGPLGRDPQAEAIEAEALAELAEAGGRPWWHVPALVLAALLFIVGAGLLAVVLGSATESDDEEPPAPIALSALPGGPPGASARLRALPDGRFRLAVRGLPAGRYVAWAYSDVISARPLGTLRGPAGAVRLRPPPDRAWRFLDVSREEDADPAHSGASVLRVARGDLRRAAAAARSE